MTKLRPNRHYVALDYVFTDFLEYRGISLLKMTILISALFRLSRLIIERGICYIRPNPFSRRIERVLWLPIPHNCGHYRGQPSFSTTIAITGEVVKNHIKIRKNANVCKKAFIG